MFFSLFVSNQSSLMKVKQFADITLSVFDDDGVDEIIIIHIFISEAYSIFDVDLTFTFSLKLIKFIMQTLKYKKNKKQF